MCIWLYLSSLLISVGFATVKGPVILGHHLQYLEVTTYQLVTVNRIVAVGHGVGAYAIELAIGKGTYSLILLMITIDDCIYTA